MSDKPSFVAELISWRTSSIPNESNLCPSCRKQPPARSRSMSFAASPRFQSSDRPNENKISYRWLRPSIAAGSNKEVITKVSYGAASGWLHRLVRCWWLHEQSIANRFQDHVRQQLYPYTSDASLSEVAPRCLLVGTRRCGLDRNLDLPGGKEPASRVWLWLQDQPVPSMKYDTSADIAANPEILNRKRRWYTPRE